MCTVNPLARTISLSSRIYSPLRTLKPETLRSCAYPKKLRSYTITLPKCAASAHPHAHAHRVCIRGGWAPKRTQLQEHALQTHSLQTYLIPPSSFPNLPIVFPIVRDPSMVFAHRTPNSREHAAKLHLSRLCDSLTIRLEPHIRPCGGHLVAKPRASRSVR